MKRYRDSMRVTKLVILFDLITKRLDITNDSKAPMRVKLLYHRVHY